VLTPKRHHSESVLAPAISPTESSSSNMISEEEEEEEVGGDHGAAVVVQQQQQQQPLRIQHRHSPSYPPVHTSMALHHFQSHHHQQQQQQDHQHHQRHHSNQSKLSTQSSLLELASPTEKPRSLLGQSHSMGDLQQKNHQNQHLGRSTGQQHKSSISVTISSSEAVVTIAPQPPAGKPSKLQSMSLGLKPESQALSCSTPNMGEQSPTNSIDSYRSNHRLFPVSTYTEPVHSNTSQYVQHPKAQFSSGLHKSAK